MERVLDNIALQGHISNEIIRLMNDDDQEKSKIKIEILHELRKTDKHKGF